jgi:hypothetical protein
MKKPLFLLVTLLALSSPLAAQTPPPPVTVFRILYLDRAYTEEDEKMIEEGRMSRVIDLQYLTGSSTPGKEEKIAVPITRNQVSPPYTYTGPGPIRLQLTTPPNDSVATLQTPAGGGDILVILKPLRTGELAKSSTQVIVSSTKDFPPGYVCFINANDLRTAFQSSKNRSTVNPGEHLLISPERLRMNAVPLAVWIDTKPAARLIFEGALRLGPEDRIMFVAYNPPESKDLYLTNFFYLQPPPASQRGM